MTTGTKKNRVDPERIYDMLLRARTAEVCTVHFKDGRVLRGALVFNQFKGTGRLINVDTPDRGGSRPNLRSDRVPSQTS